MGQITKSFYDIVMYWKDYRITERGNITPLNSGVGNAILYDLGEPSCWACDRPIFVPEKKCRNDSGNGVDPKKAWGWLENRGQLEKCHIIPAMLGGGDDVSNAFILCRQCHEEAPDTTNKSSFIRWVYRKRKNSLQGMRSPEIIIREVDEEVTQRGLPKSDEMIAVIVNTNVKEKLESKELFGEFVHKNEGMHEFGISHSSSIAVYADWLEMLYREALAS